MKTEISKKSVTDIRDSLKSRNIDERQFRVIKEILYPNVKDETLLMAIDYCKARNLDIMKRTIQIVPIWSKEKNSTIDTIWPSIAEIRITATRTGQYAGRSEAEYGSETTAKLGKVEVTYPESCKVTVYRLVKGEPRPFTAKLFWKQEYKKLNDYVTPNTMWATRSYGQLEKCTEAAALRMAFPEEVGNDHIAEEAYDINQGLVNTQNQQSKTALLESIKFEDGEPLVKEKPVIEAQEKAGEFFPELETENQGGLNV